MAAERSPFKLNGAPARALVLLFILVVIVPTAATVLSLLATAGDLGAPPGPVVIGSALAASLLVFAILAAATSRKAIEVSAAGIAVRSTFYTVFVERAAVKTGEIRALDAVRDSTLALRLRTNGMRRRLHWGRSRQNPPP